MTLCAELVSFPEMTAEVVDPSAPDRPVAVLSGSRMVVDEHEGCFRIRTYNGSSGITGMILVDGIRDLRWIAHASAEDVPWTWAAPSDGEAVE